MPTILKYLLKIFYLNAFVDNPVEILFVILNMMYSLIFLTIKKIILKQQNSFHIPEFLVL